MRDLVLYPNRSKRAMIIDSTGTFPIQTLLEVANGCVGELTASEYMTRRPDGFRIPWREKPLVDDLLERVGITRVFDLEGVWDAIGEIRTGRDEEEREGDEEDEEEERLKGLGDMSPGAHRRAKTFVQESDGVMRSTLRVVDDQAQEQDEGEREEDVNVKTSDERSHPAQSAQHNIQEGYNGSSQDTQLAQRAETTPPVLQAELQKAAPPTSSPLSPPPPIEEPETSSPLSSLPESPSPPHSASSSSLRSELIIEPSPLKERRNTVMGQAYQGESLPPSNTSEEEEEAAGEISPSPLPSSSPPLIESQAPNFAPPTTGFEDHLVTDAVRQEDDSDTDSDTESSSDTSSYLRGEHTSPSRNNPPPPPASRWQDSKAAPPPSILLIDSLPPLFTQLFGTGSSDRTTAHKELAQLSRVLTQTSRSTIHPLTVILLNSVTIPSAPKSLDEHLMLSVFADSKVIPSFGAVYDGMCDISLLVSKVPRRQEDAEALYDGYGEHCTYTHVVECLRDDTPDLARWMEEEEEGIKRKGRVRKIMNREGRWGSFDVLRMNGELVMRDSELGRKVGEYKDVGFGRRP